MTAACRGSSPSLGPTATGKSALGIALARRFGGEVVSCDSTAVYRGFDIGTDKVPPAERGGIPHHLIDVADPIEEYSAARYAREAAAAIRDITARGRLPILVGGTGLYYRALTRGLFPGPGRDAALRARLERSRRGAGSERLHRWLRRVDPPSADAHPAARSQAAHPRARGVSPDRPSADRALRRRPSRRCRTTRSCAFALQIPAARRPPSASRAASTRSSSRACSTRCAGCSRRRAGDRAPVHRAGLPAGARAPARRARRGGDARADRAREPAVTRGAS